VNYVPLFAQHRRRRVPSATLKGPHIDFAGLSPLIALLGGATLVLMVGLLGSRWIRAQVVPALSLVALATALGLTIWQWNEQKSIVAGVADRRSGVGAQRDPDHGLRLHGAAGMAFAGGARSGTRRVHALLLTSVAGMSLLAAAQNTVALFVGLELLSLPLYVLCATELRREHSLEAG